MASDSDQQDLTLFRYSLAALYLIAPPTYLALRFLQAPYGKHHRPGWGPTLPPPLAWFLMESPTLWLSLLLFPSGRHRSDLRSLLLFAPFLLHYLNRTLLFPIRLLANSKSESKSKSPGFPASVAAMAFGYNVLNAYVQARSVSEYVDYETDRWFWWRFPAGLAVFFVGMAVNVWSDAVLVRLRREGGGYRVPRGGWFEAVSCPNYFGEILEWFGWAVMCGSWAGFGFFVYTCANLIPRARANHRWYLEKFGEDYPKNRKAVIPFLY